MPPEASRPPLIDLGTDFDVEPPRPSRRRRIRDVRLSDLRRWSARTPDRPLRIRVIWWGVPMILVLLVVPSSALPGRPPLTQVARVALGANASVLVSGGDAIIVDFRDGRNEISRYALRDSRTVWTKPLDMVAAATGVRVVNGVVVASTAATPVATEAFDLNSGERLWRQTDSVAAIGADGYLYTQPAETSSASIVSRVAPRTGKVGWSLATDAGCAMSFGQDANGLATQLVEMCLRAATRLTRSIDAPTLDVVDLSTGLVTARRDLTYSTGEADFYLLPPQRLTSPELTIVGDLALVTHNNVPTPTIDAFDVNTLAPRWTGMPITNIDSLSACGPQICLQEGANESVIDPATGKAIPGATTPGAGARSRLVLVPVPAGFAYSIPQVVAGVNVAVPTASNGTAWIDVQQPRTGSIPPPLTRIQPVAGVGPRSCFTSDGYLVCATGRNQLTLWRLPSADPSL